MDELAEAAGQDALEFRRKLMSDRPKSLAVLNAVAEKGGLGQACAQGPLPRPVAFPRLRQLRRRAGGNFGAGRQQGEGAQDRRRDPTPGYAVNPAQIERQISGSFVYGLSALFMQECTVKDGAIVQSNFHDYNSMRLAQMPKVESIVMPSGGFWGGVGEPTICVAAPAGAERVLPRGRASASARSRSRTTASKWCEGPGLRGCWSPFQGTHSRSTHCRLRCRAPKRAIRRGAGPSW